MGGGSSQQPTQQTVTSNTSNLPAYAQPYMEDVMQRAQGASNQQYTPYQGQQVAGFTPAQQQVQDATMGMQAPGQFGQATNLSAQAGLGALQAGANYNPAQVNAQQVNAQGLSQYQMAGPQQWDSSQAQQYMSPYEQNVLDVQKQQAVRDAQKSQLTQNLGASRQGTYGGARQLLATTENERNLNTNLANIEATGMQNAYQSAQQQFNTQQQLGQQANQANLSALLGVQQLGSGQNLQAQQANQQAGLQAQQANLQSQQFGANLGLQGLTQANQAGQTLSNLGTAQQQANLGVLQAQSAVGNQQQSLQQQIDTQNQQNFMNQQYYPMQQLSYFSDIMHGVPISNNTTSTVSTPAPSAISQIGGLGLGALSLAKLAG